VSFVQTVKRSDERRKKAFADGCLEAAEAKIVVVVGIVFVSPPRYGGR